MHIAVVLVGCSKTLIGTGWAISLYWKTLTSPCRGSISGIVGSLQSVQVFVGLKAH